MDHHLHDRCFSIADGTLTRLPTPSSAAVLARRLMELSPTIDSSEVGIPGRKTEDEVLHSPSRPDHLLALSYGGPTVVRVQYCMYYSTVCAQYILGYSNSSGFTSRITTYAPLVSNSKIFILVQYLVPIPAYKIKVLILTHHRP